MTAQTRAQVRELLERHGLSPRKSLGQHFLADPNITAKIVSIAGVGASSQVVEIGPGTGTLTAALAGTGARVVAFEIDASLQSLLAEVLAPFPNAEVRFVDATRVDLGDALPPGEWTLVANLPYNVGTPLVLDILRNVDRVTRLVVMVQREVADRLVASPGSRTYGLPSVVSQLHGVVKMAFVVPPQVFVPAPNVGSAVVVIDRRPSDSAAEEAIRIAAAAFGQRRKMLRSTLAGVIERPTEVLEAVGIDPTSRPEDLGPDQFLALAREATHG